MNGRRVLLGMVLLAGSPLWANGRGGATGAAFLKIAPGARATALGEAFTGVADDASALLWNPAGLAGLSRPQVTATHTQWLREADHDFLAAAVPAAGGTVGFGVTSFEVPDIAKRVTDTDEADGHFDARDAAYSVGYGRRWGDAWAFGATARYVRETLDGHSAGAPAVTLGALWRRPGGRWSAGLALRDLGGRITFDDEGDPLPTALAAGVSCRLWRDRLMVTSDVRQPGEGDLSVGGGAEFSRALFQDGRGHVRLGYNSAATDAGDGAGVAVGAGLDAGRWGFDLTWAPYGVLGDTFRYAFRVSF